MRLSVHPNLALRVEMRECPGCGEKVDMNAAAWHEFMYLFGRVGLIVWCHKCRTVVYGTNVPVGIPYPGDGEHIITGTLILP